MKEENEINFFIIKCISQTTSFRESNMNEFLQINLSQNPFHLLCSFLKRVYEETDVNRLTSLSSLMKKVYRIYKKVHPNKFYDSSTKAQGFQHPPQFKFIFQANTSPSTENRFPPKENTKQSQ
ncbi:hypothetical protein V8G54_012117 [Vigna mungo]|uniref:Uncharacterized protein n=1 Tax=Vigna mungo TaxID=3915 RepID=A0AAQ3S3I0_VIGMU